MEAMESAVHLKVIQPLSWILSHLSGLYPIWIYFGYDKNVEEHQQKKVRLSMSTLTDCTFLLIDIIQLHLPMLHFILRKKHFQSPLTQKFYTIFIQLYLATQKSTMPHQLLFLLLYKSYHSRQQIVGLGLLPFYFAMGSIQSNFTKYLLMCVATIGQAI